LVDVSIAAEGSEAQAELANNTEPSWYTAGCEILTSGGVWQSKSAQGATSTDEESEPEGDEELSGEEI